ncbi:5'-3' exoribonuclease 2, partial [Frankliniella fusca]
MSADKTFQKYIIISPAALKRLRGEGSMVAKLDAEREARLEKASSKKGNYDDFLRETQQQQQRRRQQRRQQQQQQLRQEQA